MDVSVYIARRLGFRSDDGQKQSSSVTIAVVGIALSMTIMILAITVVMGFKSQIREKVMGVGASITISASEAYDEFGRFVSSTVTLNDLRTVKDAVSGEYDISLALSQSGVLKTKNDFLGIGFDAFDSNHEWGAVGASLVDGEIPDFNSQEGDGQILLSKTTADILGLSVGEKIDAYFFTNDNLKARRFNVAGIYDTHFVDFDNSHCFISLRALQRIAGVDSVTGTRVEVSQVPSDLILPLSTSLEDKLYDDYLNRRASGDTTVRPLKVDNVMRSGAVYFSWLDLLDTNVIVIIILMAAVSGFTLVSCLFILILERVKLIGVLKSLGATNGQIGKMFIYLAEKIIVKGLVIGNAIGLGIAFIQWKFQILPLDASAYYLTAVPVRIDVTAIAILNISALIVSTAILLIPARMISRISPAATMKYE